MNRRAGGPQVSPVGRRLHGRVNAIRTMALVVVAVLTIASCSSAASKSGISDKAATFSGTTLDGEPFDNVSVEGKPEVLWFWAPWCTVCRAESGDVANVARAFDGRVTFVGIAGRGKVPEMRRFVSETGTDGFSHVSDESGDLWKQFGVSSQPSFVFIDGSGKATRVTGNLDEKALSTRVQSLLAG